MRSLILALPLLAAACMSTPRLERVDPAAAPFPVASFFQGRTEGRGELDVMMSGSRDVRVTSLGRTDADRTIRLDQTIYEEGEAARTRIWHLREVAPGRYTGTLSDATGPVTGTANGNRLHLSFEMRGDMDVDQWLTLADDGRSARNVLRVSKFGITVATLEETIRKLD